MGSQRLWPELFKDSQILQHFAVHVCCSGEGAQIGREPTRKAACRLCSKSRGVGSSATPFSFPFVIYLRSKLALGSRSVTPHLPIRTHHMEDSGRILERRAACNYTDYGWISVDRNGSRSAALRWRAIRSVDSSRWNASAVLLCLFSFGCARWESMDRDGRWSEPLGQSAPNQLSDHAGIHQFHY